MSLLPNMYSIGNQFEMLLQQLLQQHPELGSIPGMLAAALTVATTF